MKTLLIILCLCLVGCATCPKSGTYNDDSVTWDNTKWDCNWVENGLLCSPRIK